MPNNARAVENGDRCVVVAGTHRGKTGTVEDKKASKSGAVTITIRQDNDVRLKTLGKNVERVG